jgi:DNA-binding NarL/FixJ family response regulator
VATTRGTALLAARLFGAAEAVRVATGLPRPPGPRAAHAQGVAAARAALDEAAFDAAWAAGRALDPDEAHAEAHAAVAEMASPPRSPAYPLSAREHEVAVLIARGLTDRQIAEQLVITSGTVGQHVVHILDKLGFRSRAQVAAWVVERGLHTSPPEGAKDGTAGTTV